jgi:hypothetical protein
MSKSAAPNEAIPNAQSGQNVVIGTVVSTFMYELTGLVKEIAQHRLLGEDLRAWFAAHPEIDERFGAFQRARQKERASAHAKQKKRAKAKKR